MAARSIASLSLSFGLVSIPVKLYAATESSAAIRFKLMSAGGARLRQQYVAEEAEPSPEPGAGRPAPAPGAPARPATAERVVDFASARRDAPVPAAAAPEAEPEAAAEPSLGPSRVERSDMVKGYEYEKGKFVLFDAAELKALEAGSRQTIDIVAFVPAQAVDPVYYDKAYFLAPDKRGAKPYSLLLRAMRESGRTALAKWAWRAKEYVVQIRPVEGGLVLQQLLYADEVRSIESLPIELAEVGEGEVKLATQLIGQLAAEAYDPAQFVDEEKQRLLEAIRKKVEGREVAVPEAAAPAGPGSVVDLMEALRASLSPAAERKPVRRTRKAAASRRSA